MLNALAQRLQHTVDHGLELLRSGQAKVDDADLFLQFRRNFEHRAEDDHGLVAGLQADGHLAQPPHDLWVLEEGMEIAQHPQARLFVLQDGAQQKQGIALGGVLAFGQGRVDDAHRAAPEQNALALQLGQRFDLGDGALFFSRHHPKQRIAGANVKVKLLFHHLQRMCGEPE